MKQRGEENKGNKRKRKRKKDYLGARGYEVREYLKKVLKIWRNTSSHFLINCTITIIHILFILNIIF